MFMSCSKLLYSANDARYLQGILRCRKIPGNSPERPNHKRDFTCCEVCFSDFPCQVLVPLTFGLPTFTVFLFQDTDTSIRVQLCQLLCLKVNGRWYLLRLSCDITVGKKWLLTFNASKIKLVRFHHRWSDPEPWLETMNGGLHLGLKFNPSYLNMISVQNKTNPYLTLAQIYSIKSSFYLFVCFSESFFIIAWV